MTSLNGRSVDEDVTSLKLTRILNQRRIRSDDDDLGNVIDDHGNDEDDDGDHGIKASVFDGGRVDAGTA